MLKKLTASIGVYEEEIQLFLWAAVVLFLVSSGGSILTNYADTAFLKRYGVEYMPVVNMINAVATVVVMGFVAGLIQRVSGTLLLSRMFLFSGLSVAIIRALIPLELNLIYPLLFMLKAQYEVLLALLFWNLANDLFNTQQAKRLFPLLTAGGVVGQILASFGTPWFARTLTLDNLLLAYLAITLAGALLLRLMARQFPTLRSGGDNKKSQTQQKRSMMEEFRRVWPMMKDSTLVKIMVLLTFLPNVVIPIINYQFNYAVNEQFDSESDLLEFFGYMRGVLNIISLVLLLFVGKIYGRWGLPVALMFHPFNYILAFLSFFFQFNVISALYARMSTEILRTSINMPATSIITGLFPQSYRAMIRPFLRGTVVRLGLFIGSTLILISDSLFHPRFLSLVALPFVIAWLFAPFWLKRRYTDILTDLVSGDMSDIKSMETEDINQLFRDPAMRRKLREDFSRSQPKDCVWYGELLKTVRDEQLNQLVLDKLDGADTEVQIRLLDLLSNAESQAVSVLSKMALGDDPRLQVAAIATLVRLVPSALTGEVDITPLIHAPSIEVRAQAAAALLPTDSDRYETLILGWIDEADADLRLSGVIAAGVSGDPRFAPSLSRLLNQESIASIRAAVLEALRHIEPQEINALAEPYLVDPSADVRLAAVAAFRIASKAEFAQLIPLLGDTSPLVSQLVKKQIIEAPFQDGRQLIKALSNPRRKVREEIFSIIEALDIKDLDKVRFVSGQAQGAYNFLVQAQAAGKLSDCPERRLLEEHLRQLAQLKVENIIRVLAAQDTSGKMRIVSRGLLSSDSRQKANSQEALGDLLDGSLASIVCPLIDSSPIEHKIAAGRKSFKLNSFSAQGADITHHLLANNHWITRVIALEVATRCAVIGIDPDRIAALKADSDNKHVQRAAERLLRHLKNDSKNEEAHMEDSMAITEKILLLKRIDIFAGLSVSELSAIASVTEAVDCVTDTQVINQGDTGDALYLIITGKVAVRKKLDDGTQVQLDQILAGDYFGEMALFEAAERSASIVTLEPTRLLLLHKQDFTDMVQEYPRIALAICNALSNRIRTLHQKMKA